MDWRFQGELGSAQDMWGLGVDWEVRWWAWEMPRTWEYQGYRGAFGMDWGVVGI